MTDIQQPQDSLPLFGNINAVSEEERLRLSQEAEAKRAAFANAVANAPGLDQSPSDPNAWELANLLENSTVSALHAAQQPNFPVDPNFQLTPDKLKTWMDGLPKNIGYEDEFLNVGSDKEGEQVAARLREHLDFDMRLGSQGFAKNFLYRFGASLSDPTMWAAGAVTGGAGRYLGFLRTGSRAVRAAKAAALMGTESVVPETVLQETQPGRDASNFYYTLLGGVALGGLTGALSKSGAKGLSAAERRAVQDELLKKMHTLDSLEAAARGEVGPPAPHTMTDVLETTPPREAQAADTAVVKAEAQAADNVAPAAEESVVKAEAKAATEEAPPSLNKVAASSEETQSLPTKLRERADEVGAQAKSTGRLLNDATQALEAVRRVQATVETKVAGDGVVKVTRKAGARDALDFEKLPPAVRALVEGIVDESGVITPKALRELENRVTDLTKEVQHLQNKETTMRRIANMREKPAAAVPEAAPAPAEERSVGAAQAAVDRIRKEFWDAQKLTEAQLHEILNAPTASFGGARFDIASSLMGAKQKNPFVRWLASKTLEEPVGFTDNRLREFSAELRRQLYIDQTMSEVAKAVEPAYVKWLNESGHGMAGRLSFDLRQQFMENVSEHIRFGTATNANVRAAAEEYTAQFKKWWDKAAKAGVAGFEGDSRMVANYLPRKAASDKVRLADVNFGTKQVLDNLIIPAVARANADLEQSVVELLARGWWERVRKLAAGVDIHDFRGMELGDREFVTSLLQDIGVGNDGIEYVLTALKGKRPETTGVSHGKARLLLDESTEADLTHGPHSEKQGTTERTKITDLLFENNAEDLFNHYVHTMSGHVSMAEVGFKSKADWTAMLNQAAKYADHLGVSKEETAKARKQLEYVWDSITGVPVWGDPASALNVWSRRLRGVEMIRVGGMLGMAQLPETGYLLSHLGIRHILSAGSEFFSMFRRGADNELLSKLAREMETLTGSGTEWLRHIQVGRWDHMERGGAFEGAAKHMAKFDKAVDLGKRMTMVASMMTPVNTVLQRLTLRGIAHKFAKGRNMYNAKRLADLGLRPEDADRIAAEINKHASREPSMWFKDGKITALNIEKWDKEVLNLFTYSTHRLARRIVLQNDLGSAARWMSHPMAKLMLFFRNFVIGSYSKMFLHNVKMADAMAMASALTSMFTATLVYYGRVYAQSVGMSESQRKEYLARNLTPEKVALRGWQATSWSSIAPMGLGQLEKAFGGTESLFMRTSGQASDAIFGTPLIGHFDAAMEGLAGSAKSARSGRYNFSRQDLRNLWQGFVPFNNTLAGIAAMNALGRPLPAHSK